MKNPLKISQKPILKHIPEFINYLRLEKKLSPKTLENYFRFLVKFQDYLKDSDNSYLFPYQLDVFHINAYRKFLLLSTLSNKQNKTLKKSTQNYYLIALRSFLTFFNEKNIISLSANKIKLIVMRGTQTQSI